MEREIIYIGDNTIILMADGGKYRLPSGSEAPFREDAGVYRFDNYVAVPSCGIGCGDYSNDPGGDDEDSGGRFVRVGIREAYGLLPADRYAAVVKGAELVNWGRTERFCGSCGTQLERATEISRRCPLCGREYFPRLSPAVVVLVLRGEEALLVHARNFRDPDMMALVAGFVETGETPEECVIREIREETGLEVEDVRYIGSQSWPFPHQLMLGFTARYAGGELRFADGELSAGGFFTRDNVPVIPTPPSLSRQIIDMWINGEVR